MWQHLLEWLDPVAFSIGFLSVHWYGICFLLGIAAVWLWLKRDQKHHLGGARSALVDEFLFVMLIGALIGARLGYALWYAPAYFLEYPLALISPFDPLSGGYVGFSGLSFHGALVGLALACFIWTARQQQDFLIWIDRIVLAVPLGIFFGRIGNFMNGELWGRPTEMVWGVYFPLADSVLRHPSPLYEALGEGVLLFVVLSLLRRYVVSRSGQMGAWFLFLYGWVRFLLEYFREPDIQVGLLAFEFSLGQWLSLGLIGLGGVILWLLRGKYRDMV
ncbi:MAG: prolipoprotein diacylglyceryl transferase [Candidatus Moranbacteria bacterium]|nr:prolipoprotein diacylglyceryl transferase [Candidatus Moranbacteria bacterium]MBP7696093.1 prolipoprotein diacylglyceryl transferase [Candidatus Moranbacteria bacterium]